MILWIFSVRSRRQAACRTLCWCLLFSCLVSNSPGFSSTTEASKKDIPRWYTPAQVARGKPLFLQHCAKCHGKQAESVPDWQKPLADGTYPPPPLNGSAHTWHHSLALLRRTVREGGAAVGGKMPPFIDKLSASEIDAIIAWLQSLWPDEIYARWSGAYQPRIPQPEIFEELLRDIR